MNKIFGKQVAAFGTVLIFLFGAFAPVVSSLGITEDQKILSSMALKPGEVSLEDALGISYGSLLNNYLQTVITGVVGVSFNSPLLHQLRELFTGRETNKDDAEGSDSIIPIVPADKTSQKQDKDPPLPLDPADPWWNTDWPCRKEITINHTKVTTHLIYFPVLINITDIDLRDDAQTTGNDIVFTTSTAVQLNHEIEIFNDSTGQLVAWVNVTSLSSTENTTLYMYYGNPSCSSQETPQGVWDSHYVMVQHLDESSGTDYDSTSYGNNGTPQGDMNQNAVGKINGADSFDGTDDYINLGQPSSLNFNPGTSEFSISFWFKTTQATGTFIAKADATVATRQYHLLVSSNKLASSGGNIPFATAVTVNDGLWHYAVFVNYDVAGTKKSRFFIDGVADATIVTPTSVTNSFDVLIGARRGTGNTGFAGQLNGIMDEVRISNVARSAGWISTKYNNQHNPSTFYSVGSEELLPGSPVVANPVPVDGSMDIPVSLSELSFQLLDYQEDSMNYTVTMVPDYIGGMQSDIDIANGTTVHILITSSLEYATTYIWSVNVTDGTHWMNETFSFTTEKEIITNPFTQGWTYRKSITIDHTKVASTLNNFPVLLNITCSDLCSKAQVNGGDIIFMDGIGVATQLAHEIEYYDSTKGALVVWVNVTSLSSTENTTLYMYYGNPSCNNQENPQGVWDSNYVMVQHLDETDAGTRYDSTSSMNNGIPNNYDGDEAVTGKINGADSFDGTNDYIVLGQPSSLNFNPYTTEFSISFWFKTAQTSGTFIAKGGTTVPTRQYHLLTSTGKLASSGGNSAFTTTVTVNDSVWHYAVFVNYDESGIKKSKFFIDGVADTTIGTPTSVTNSFDVLIGARRGASNADFLYPFNGIIDEVRISNVARSAGWISTKYNNQHDPGTFYTVGSEQLPPDYSIISNPHPENSETAVPVSLSEINFTLIDNQNDLMNYTVAFNPDIIGGVQSGTGILNNTVVHIPVTDPIAYNTSYIWFVNVTDGSHWTNKTFTFTTELGAGPWWNTGWLYRKEVMMNHSKIAANLSNFPVLINISDDDLKNYAQLNGDDIVFTDYYGNQLHHEIEYYDSSSGRLVVWVNVTSLSSTEDTTLYMYYGNPSCSNQENPPGVWDSHYVMVQHLDETSGTDYDSTSYGNNGAPQGSMNQNVTGKISGADSFDGTDDYIVLGQPSSLNFNPGTTEFSISFWFKTTQASGTFIAKADSTIPARQYHLLTSDGMLHSSGGNAPFSSGVGVNDGVWHYAVFVNNDESGTKKSMYYIDGVADDTNVTPSSVTNSFDVLIGARRGASNSDFLYSFDGTMDEVRISNVARSAGWISTKYNNQYDPSTFYDVGNVESQAGYPLVNSPVPQNSAAKVMNSLTEVSFTLFDYENDLLDYSVIMVPDSIGGLQSDTDIANGTTVHIPITGFLDGNTTYAWKVNVTDGSHWTNVTFSFTTVSDKPYVVSPSPADDATDVPMSLAELCFTLLDYQNDLMNYTVTITPDIIGGVHSNTNVANDTTICIPIISYLGYDITYTWNVNVTDGEYWTNETFSFITESAPGMTEKWSTDVGAVMRRDFRTADVTGDDAREVIVVSEIGHFVKAYYGDNGSLIWSHYDPDIKSEEWAIRLEIADLNNDGIPEIVLGLEPSGVLVLHGNNGSVYWKLTGLGGDSVRSNPCIFDLDLDGYPTIFVSTYKHYLYEGTSLYSISYNGTINFEEENAVQSCAGGISIMDYDNDGHFEIYVGGSYGAGNARVQSYWVENLTLRVQSDPLPGHFSAGMPVLADYTGDGVPEIMNVRSDASGNWPDIYVFSADDLRVLQIITPGGDWELFESAIYDIDGDGHKELISASDRLSVYDLVDQTYDFQTPISNSWFQATVGDVTGDGVMEILCPSQSHIKIFDKNYIQIGTLPLDQTSMFCYAVVDDIDGDDHSEIIVQVGSQIQAFETSALMPAGGLRGGIARYSEYRNGVAEYITVLGLKDEYPARGSLGLSLNPTLSVNVTNYQFELMNVTFRTNASGSWQDIIQYSNVGNGVYNAFPSGMIQTATTYYWSVNATDRINTWTNMTYCITTYTVEPIVQNPIPVSGSINIPVTISELRFTLTDNQNDLMDYTVSINPDIIDGPQTGNNIVNGTTVHIPITSDSLEYNTVYTWWVNVTDGANWAKKTFTFTTESGPGPWWNTGWQYRKEILINHSKVAGNLRNFPFLINVTDANLKNHAQIDGGDIVFTDYYGNQLHHEIEYYDSISGRLIIWVNVTSLSSTENTTLYMYYGNPSCSNKENPQGVWDSNYKMVQHLDETDTGTRYDSTSNMNNGIPQNYDGDEDVSGKINGADSMDGVNDYINIGQPASLDFTPNTDEFSISFWIKTSFNNTIIAKAGNTITQRQYFFTISTSKLYAHVGGSVLDSGLTLNDGVWHYVVGVNYDDSGTKKFKLYIDGIADDTIITSGSATNSFDILLGARRGASNSDFLYPFNGIMDEIRMSSSTRNSSWIETEYYNQNNPATFYNIGNEENRLIPPTVALMLPENKSILLDKNLTFVSVINDDTGVKNVSLYTNISGSWQKEDTTTIIPGEYNYDDEMMLWMHFNNESRLGENYQTSSLVYDYSDTNNHGAKDGVNYIANGKCGGAFSFDGVNDRIRVPTTSSLNFGQHGTIAFWLNWSGTALAYDGVLSRDGGSGSWSIRLSHATSDHLQFRLFLEHTFDTLITPSTNSWEHWALTINGTKYTWYQNGVQVAQETYATTSIVHLGDLYVGAYNNQGDFDYLQGLIDEVAIYNRSLNENEIQKLASGGDVTQYKAIFKQSNLLDGIYQWTCDAYDIDDNTAFAQENWTFTIDAIADSPFLTNEYPATKKESVLLNPTLAIDIEDPQNDPLSVTFMTNESGSWAPINVVPQNGGNERYEQVTTVFDEYFTKYWWCVNVSDDENHWVNETFYFTTCGEVIDTDINTVLSVIVHSPTEEYMDVTFQGDGVILTTLYDVPNGGTASYLWDTHTYGSTHRWNVTIDDGVLINRSRDYTFTVVDPLTLKLGYKSRIVDILAGNHDIVCGDYNNDLLLDFAVEGYTANSLYWYEQKPGYANFSGHLIDNTVKNAHDLQQGDINGDGQLDFVCLQLSNNSGNYNEPPAKVFWYEKDKTSMTWIRHLIEENNTGYLIGPRQAAIIDIDNDGDNDVVVATDKEGGWTTGGYIIWYENINGDGNTWERYNVGNNTLRMHQYIKVADLDQDGNLDFSTTGTQFWIYWGTSNPRVDNWTKTQIGSISWSCHQVYDFDNDGDLDIVAGGLDSTKRISIFENPGGSNARSSSEWNEHVIDTSTYNLRYKGIRLYDMNADGYTDVLAVGNGEGTPYLGSFAQIHFNQGTLDDWESMYLINITETNNNFYGVHEVEIGDFNDDNIMDFILAGCYSNKIVLYSGFNYTYPPKISFTLPTPSNGSTLDSTFIPVNTSVNVSQHSYAFIDFNDSAMLWLTMDKLNATWHPLDSSSHNIRLVKHGNAYSDFDSVFGRAFMFDNDEDYISFNDNVSQFENLHTGTISAWVFWESSDVDNSAAIFSAADSSDLSSDLSLVVLSGHLEFIVRENAVFLPGANVGDLRYSNFPHDAWHHVVVTQNGSYIRLFVDGMEMDNSQSTAWFSDVSEIDALTIGSRDDSAAGVEYELGGQIDDVIIFNRALSVEEIKSLYNASEFKLEHEFMDLPRGIHNFIGYVVDKAGNINNTEKRTIILVPSAVPILSNEYPQDDSDDVIINPTLSIYAEDYQADNLLIKFMTNATEIGWSQIGSTQNGYNNTFTQATTMFDAYNTRYWWSVNVSDDENHWTNETYTFKTTILPTVTLVSPSNNSVFHEKNIQFIANINDDGGVKNASLYTNIGGSWHLDQLINTSGEYPFDAHMILWMHFNNESSVGENYGSSNLVHDYGTYTNDGTKDGVSYNALGKYGGAFSFDGTNDKITVPTDSSLNFGQYGTIAFWMKWSGIATDFDGIISRDGGANTWAIRIAHTVSDHLQFRIFGKYTVDSGVTPSTGWEHWAITINGSQYTWFRNGVQVKTESYTGATIAHIGPVLIGSYYDGGNYDFYNGLLDEVAVYNRVLSNNEISRISSDNYPLSFTASFNIQNIPDGSYQWRCKAYDNNINYNWSSETRRFSVASEPKISYISPTPLNGSVHDLDYIFVNTFVEAWRHSYAFIDFNRSNLLWLPMDTLNGSGHPQDQSCHNIKTLKHNNAQQIVDGGVFKDAFIFDNDEDYISFNDNVSLFQDLATGTISAWVYWSSTDIDTNGAIFSAADSSDPSSDMSLTFYLNNLAFFVRENAIAIPGAEVGTIQYGGGSYPKNTWHHVAVTQNGTMIRLYVDSVEVDSSSSSAWFDDVLEIDALTIGARDDSSAGVEFELGGKIDDFTIYNRWFDAVEIKALYNSTDNPLYHNFTYLPPDTYNFTSYIVDTDGTMNSTGRRTITLSSTTAALYTISLDASWNLISLPFNETKGKTEIMVRNNSIDYSWADAVSNHIVLDSFYDWTGTGYEISASLAPGAGYWVWVYYSCSLILSSSKVEDARLSSLQIGWNIIGLPVNSTLMKSSLLINYSGYDYTWEEATSGGDPILLGFIYGWDRINQMYMMSDTFEPGQSYWMYAYKACSLKKEG